MAQHYFSNTSVEVLLSTAMTNSQTTMVVPESATDNNWPTGQGYPFTLAIDFGTVGVEIIDVTSKGALASGLRTWNVTRGMDFTVGSAHSVGARIRHVVTGMHLLEARQARWLQPDDTLQTYIVQESTNGTQFTDSLAGDLIQKFAPSKRMLFGSATNPLSALKLSDTKILTQGIPVDVSGGLQALGSGIDITAAWQSCAATWASNGTSPNFYSGTTRYLIFGKILIFSVYFKAAASGWNPGTGTYQWNLGITGQTARGSNQMVAGWADASSGGTQRFAVTTNVGTTSGVSLDRAVGATPTLGLAATGYVLGGTTYAWAASSEIRFTGIVELA